MNILGHTYWVTRVICSCSTVISYTDDEVIRGGKLNRRGIYCPNCGRFIPEWRGEKKCKFHQEFAPIEIKNNVSN